MTIPVKYFINNFHSCFYKRAFSEVISPLTVILASVKNVKVILKLKSRKMLLLRIY